MQAASSSETFVDFQRTARLYIPEDITIQKIFTPNNNLQTLNAHLWTVMLNVSEYYNYATDVLVYLWGPMIEVSPF
jgi:hypothetical protein